jgi:hypothetical protein
VQGAKLLPPTAFRKGATRATHHRLGPRESRSGSTQRAVLSSVSTGRSPTSGNSTTGERFAFPRLLDRADGQQAAAWSC